MIDIHLPYGFLILVYLLAWPGIILNEFFGIILPNFYLSFLLGVVVNSIILFLVGMLLDKKFSPVYKLPYKVLLVLISLGVYLLAYLLALTGISK